MQFKGFYHFTESWYGESQNLPGNEFDDIVFGFYAIPREMRFIPGDAMVKDPLPSGDAEIKIVWENINGTIFSTVVAHVDGMEMLQRTEVIQVFNMLGNLQYVKSHNKHAWDVEDVKKILKDCGFMDVTKTHRDDEPAEVLAELDSDK